MTTSRHDMFALADNLAFEQACIEGLVQAHKAARQKHTITLYRHNGNWIAHHTEPHIVSLFGSEDIPTAFRDSTPAMVVLSEIRALNPDYVVVLREGEAE